MGEKISPTQNHIPLSAFSLPDYNGLSSLYRVSTEPLMTCDRSPRGPMEVAS